MTPNDIKPAYVPELNASLYPMAWQDDGHWLIVKGFRPIAAYHGGYFSSPREVYDDFVSRFVVDTCEATYEPHEQPSFPVDGWGEHHVGCGFAIFRNGQPRGAWVEFVGGGADPIGFYELPAWGEHVTLTGTFYGSADGLFPLPEGWPSRSDLIRDGKILLTAPVAPLPPEPTPTPKKPRTVRIIR